MSNEVKVIDKDVKDMAFPEITRMQMEDSYTKLVAIMPEHKPMLEVISQNLPEVHRATSLFFKTQSQFMDNLMTVNHNTPLRNLRQILAQMNTTREAMKEAYFKLKKKDIEIQKKQRKLEKLLDVNGKLINEDDDLKADMLEIEIQELMSQAETTRGYISGAIRQLTNYTTNYNSIKEKHNIGEFTEADFEAEEERYHIMKTFSQAMSAARSRPDFSIDEGNQIYLEQIGINGGHAQHEIRMYLATEQMMLRGQAADPEKNIPAIPPVAPSHAMYLEFLNNMANHFAGSAKEYAKAKGMVLVTPTALIDKGDTRFLQIAQAKEPVKE